MDLRIGFLNLQSGIDITRGYHQYALKAWKFLLPHSQKPLKRLTDFLEKSELDILLFSEIDGGSGRTRGINQVEHISKNSTLKHPIFFPIYRVGNRINQGNGICSRWPITKSRNIRLPGGGQPRHFGVADVLLPSGKSVRFCVTHLSLNAEIRREQVMAINRGTHFGKEPVVLGGDFNFRKSNEITLMGETAFQKIIIHPTYPSWKPKYYLDHLFTSQHFEITESKVINSPKFSDHLLITARIRLME